MFINVFINVCHNQHVYLCMSSHQRWHTLFSSVIKKIISLLMYVFIRYDVHIFMHLPVRMFDFKVHVTQIKLNVFMCLSLSQSHLMVFDFGQSSILSISFVKTLMNKWILLTVLTLIIKFRHGLEHMNGLSILLFFLCHRIERVNQELTIGKPYLGFRLTPLRGVRAGLRHIYKVNKDPITLTQLQSALKSCPNGSTAGLESVRLDTLWLWGIQIWREAPPTVPDWYLANSMVLRNPPRPQRCIQISSDYPTVYIM